jgi:hypothetical protein
VQFGGFGNHLVGYEVGARGGGLACTCTTARLTAGRLAVRCAIPSVAAGVVRLSHRPARYVLRARMGRSLIVTIFAGADLTCGNPRTHREHVSYLGHDRRAA